MNRKIARYDRHKIKFSDDVTSDAIKSAKCVSTWTPANINTAAPVDTKTHDVSQHTTKCACVVVHRKL